MKCDRLLKDLSGIELQSIESKLPRSGIPFLKPNQHFRDIERADEAVIKKHQLDLPSMIGKVDRLIDTARATITKFTDDQPSMSKMAGGLQYVNDKANNLKRALDTIFGQPPPTNPGVTVINNWGRTPDANEWKGPNPFGLVPTNPEWSCWYRWQAPVIDGDRVYIVASITWGGAQKCPFQHPDDHGYHGYEYGSHDHLIIFPGFGDNETIMLLSDLSLHMARAHGFCGTKSVYRIDPVALANLLGCGPNNKVNPPGFAAAMQCKLQEAEEGLAAKSTASNAASSS